MDSRSASVVTSDFTEFARQLARAARRQTLTHFASDLLIENKGEGASFDPVTEADRAAEATMRELIERCFPDHGISGEEFGERSGKSAYLWSLDPIDGTRSYLCGLPTWVTLIALVRDGTPVLGVIDAPCIGELYFGTAEGAWLDSADTSRALRTSACTALAETRLSTTDPYLFNGAAADAFAKLRRSSRTVRFGHDGYAYARLAAGTLDLIVECGLKPHDYNALIPIVRGAGGTFGDWRGGTDFGDGNVIAAATRALYDEAVAIMREAS